MKFKNLFIIIFLINTKILVYSEYYGNILITYEGSISIMEDFNMNGIEINFNTSECSCIISFSNDTINLIDIFQTVLRQKENIRTIEILNLKIILKSLKGIFSNYFGLTKI